ncbi:hypothetical protein HFP15_24160 [Amycolatopsis sp. K13G38]|uniref:Beta-lactamase class A catalytic domain-containing protein n=1 Tax=Amycolatopsis acididurans TaxID=2724524 RepID=A0ABX1J863_9PSEU|nr:serine hydrolase [Amycolatopsis acididurans]NKQ55977.1 hypothetical protein [Amycolatopsis acididurans]
MASASAAVVITVAALTPAGQDPAPAVSTDHTPHANVVASPDAAIGQLVSGMPADSVSIAAQNLTTSQSYRHGADTKVAAASVIKLDILETLLLQQQDEDEPLTDAETAQATAMIENSDNDSATQLWNEVGGAAGIRAADIRLGASGTHPDPKGYWGLSTTDADDQLTLLRDLVAPASPLNPASQAFALGLMRQVEPDQAWGISAVADPGTATALKNGWLPVDDDNGLWAIGSVGIITLHGEQVLVAVLTQHDDSQGDGIELTQALARTLVPSITTPLR